MCESRIRGKKVTVVGAGVSGRALAELASALGARVFVTEVKELGDETKKFFDGKGIEWECGGNTSRALDADEIAVSSGISPQAPILAEAMKKGIKVTGELDFVNPYLSGTVIGVTGSNGKTTTTGMIGYFLEKLGYSVLTGGNIGNAAARAAGRDYDFIVLELSSFQLHRAREFTCGLAIVTNLAPDHIDWHGSYENYVAAKANLVKCLVPGGFAIYQKCDEKVLRIKDGVNRFPLMWHDGGPCEEGICLDEKSGAAWINRSGSGAKRKLFMFDDLKLLGRHNIENAAMAAGALSLLNAGEVTPGLLSSYVPPKHRCAYAGSSRGVTFVDDSKGTNVAASVTAMTSLAGTKIMILGGQGKGEDYAPLAAAVRENSRAAVLLGAEKEKIAAALDAAGFSNYKTAGDMDEAVRAAWSFAEAGDTILLSPACTSWDMYPNYNVRGEDFCRAAEEIIKAEG